MAQCQNDCWDTLQNKNKKTKRTFEQRNRVKVSNSSRAVGEAPFKQYCLQLSLECQERRRGSDFSQQSVPHTGRGYGKSTVTDGGQTCRGDDQCRCRLRMQATLRVEVRHALKIVGKVRRRQASGTAVDKNCQLILSPLSHLGW